MQRIASASCENDVSKESIMNVSNMRLNGCTTRKLSPPYSTMKSDSFYINLCASRLGSGGLEAEFALLLAAAAELTTQSVGGWEGLADALEVLLDHSTVPPGLHTTAARVVSEADEGTVLVGVQVLSVGHGADAALILGDVLLEESGTLCPGDGGVKAGAASALNAVMAETF